MSGMIFVLRNGRRRLVLERVTDVTARVVSEDDTGFLAGDVVRPAREISWKRARERVSSKRTRLSPFSLVLVREAEHSKARVHDFAAFRSSLHRDPTPAA